MSMRTDGPRREKTLVRIGILGWKAESALTVDEPSGGPERLAGDLPPASQRPDQLLPRREAADKQRFGKKDVLHRIL